jgi:Phage integrase, N-terminal SAM-like domain
MSSDTAPVPIGRLRARMIEDMTVRGFKEDTRSDYVRNVRAFAAFIGRSPDTATAEDLRLYQLHQTQSGMQPPSINSAVSALRFFFTVTLDRPDLARRLTVVPQPRRIPVVLSVEEATLLLRGGIGAEVQSGIRHRLRHRAARLGKPSATLAGPGPQSSAALSSHQPAQNHPPPTLLPDQFPIDGQLLAAVPRVRFSEAFGRRPSALARVDCSR